MQEDRQTTEVRETNSQVGDTTVQRQSVEKKTAVSGVVVAQRIIYYVGGVIIALLLVRFVLQLLGANDANGFVDFIYALSGVFVAPFYGIFGEPIVGRAQFETSTLVAIIVYGIVTVGVAKLLTLTRPHEEA